MLWNHPGRSQKYCREAFDHKLTSNRSNEKKVAFQIGKRRNHLPLFFWIYPVLFLRRVPKQSSGTVLIAISREIDKNVYRNSFIKHVNGHIDISTPNNDDRVRARMIRARIRFAALGRLSAQCWLAKKENPIPSSRIQERPARLNSRWY